MPLEYETLSLKQVWGPGIYIFADLELLSKDQMRLAKSFWKKLRASKFPVTLLNHPNRVLCRFKLLRKLYKHRVNQFNVHFFRRFCVPKKFPVFLRRDNDHKGSLTSLLRTRDEFRRKAQYVIRKKGGRGNLLVTEFCDTADRDGIYRKYSAFIVGEKVIPKHIFFSRNWLTKKLDLQDDFMIREETAYVRDNPHQAQIAEIFSMAHIQYGRIDYSMKDGRIQVWEINTNPMILRPRNEREEVRRPRHQFFSDTFDQALRELRRTDHVKLKL